MFEVLEQILAEDNAVVILVLIGMVFIAAALLGVTIALVVVVRKKPDDKTDDENMRDMIKLHSDTVNILNDIQKSINRTTNIQVQHLNLIEAISRQQAETEKRWNLKLVEHEAKAADRHDEITTTFDSWVKSVNEQLEAVKAAIDLLPVSLQGIATTGKATQAAVTRMRKTQMEESAKQDGLIAAVREMKKVLVEAIDALREEVSDVAEKMGRVFVLSPVLSPSVPKALMKVEHGQENEAE